MAIVGIGGNVVVDGLREWEDGSPSSSVIWMDGAVAEVDCSAVDGRRGVDIVDEDEGRERHSQCIIRQRNQSHITNMVDIRRYEQFTTYVHVVNTMTCGRVISRVEGRDCYLRELRALCTGVSAQGYYPPCRFSLGN